MENWKKNRLTNYSRTIFASLSILALFVVSARSESLTRMQMVMGTLLEIRLEGGERAQLEAAADTAFKEAHKCDALLSNFKADSETSRINRAAYLGPVQVSDEMIKFILLSNRLSYLTDGFFDITVEPLTRLWRLRERTLERIPNQSEIDEALAHVDSNGVDISFHNNTVRFMSEGMGIDTGGIGKGYALDRCLDKIRDFSSVRAASLNFGGELLFWSSRPEGRAFSVRNPLAPETTWDTFFISTFSAVRAVSTSGNYERSVDISLASASLARYPDGKVGHLINVKTGLPVKNEVRSVSVISTSGAEADALSTAIFCMGLAGGSKFADALADHAVLILYEEQGRLLSFKSKNWLKAVSSQI